MNINLKIEIDKKMLEPFKELLQTNFVSLNDQLRRLQGAITEDLESKKMTEKEKKNVAKYADTVLSQQYVVASILNSIIEVEERKNKKIITGVGQIDVKRNT